MHKPLFPSCKSCKTAPAYTVERLWAGIRPFEPLQCCDKHKPGSASSKPHDVAKFYRLTPIAKGTRE